MSFFLDLFDKMNFLVGIKICWYAPIGFSLHFFSHLSQIQASTIGPHFFFASLRFTVYQRAPMVNILASISIHKLVTVLPDGWFCRQIWLVLTSLSLYLSGGEKRRLADWLVF